MPIMHIISTIRCVIKRFLYILIFLLAINALLWFFSALRYIGYPYSLDFGEGILLSQSVMLSHGENIYPAINDYPYIVSNYHPLYPFLCGIPFVFLNPALWSGRLLTLLSAIGSMFLVGRIVAKISGKIEYGAVAALLPFCLNYPYNWAFVYRVDHFGIFLSLFGLYLYMFPRQKGSIYWSIIPFMFAFFTKMTFILAPIACVIDLLFKKDKKGVKYLLLLIFSIGVPYLILNLLTGFGMYRHTLIYTANAFFLTRMIEGYREILEYTLPLWMVIALSIVSGNGKFRTLIMTYLILLLISLITYGAEGSDSNYFIELIFALSIGAIIWFPSFETKNINKNNFQYMQALALILIVAFCFQGRVMASKEFGQTHNLRALAESQKDVDAIVQNTDGEIISEDITFLAKNGKRILFQPYIMSLLAREGKWDQSKFVNDLKNGRFKLIILRFDVFDPNHTDKPGNLQEAGFDRFTSEMEEAIKEGYGQPYSPKANRGKKWFLYLPKSRMNAED